MTLITWDWTHMKTLLLVLSSLALSQHGYASCNTDIGGTPNDAELRSIQANVDLYSPKFKKLKSEIGKVIVGQHDAVNNVIIGALVNGHVLLEGVPGLAKTLLIESLSQAMQGQSNRIQFVPDLMPSDILGNNFYNPIKNAFELKKGPIFTNFLLADEINRASPKLQAATLQAMAERKVTLGEETIQLDDVFVVLATQNPLDQQGTFPLPEAQMDRFIMMVKLGYPTVEEEIQILNNQINGQRVKINPVMTLDDLREARKAVQAVYIDQTLIRYCADLVAATRFPTNYGLKSIADFIEQGASPRGTLALMNTAKAYAFLDGRNQVTENDIRAVSKFVLSHRIKLHFKAEAEKITRETVVEKVVGTVKVSPAALE